MSATDQWCTPRDLAELLGEFDLDVCSNSRSHIRARRSYRLDDGEDGLACDWGVDTVWCNPPYSDPLPWMLRLAGHRGPWSSLVKLDTTTRWWATAMVGADAWAPFRRRLSFEWIDESKPRRAVATFASALIWGGGWRPATGLRALLWDVKKGSKS